METLIKKEKLVETHHNVSQYINAIKKIMNDINNYVIRHDLKICDSDILINENLIKKWHKNNGSAVHKRFKRIINKCQLKPTLAAYNIFFHYLYKNVYKSDVRVRLRYMPKHEKIIKLRKEFYDARKKMEEALAAYKNEKGDFFKKRMIKEQIIQ